MTTIINMNPNATPPVQCALKFDQCSYRPGQTVKCSITLTFSEELKYRSISVRFLGQSTTNFQKKKLSSFKYWFAGYTGTQEHFRWFKDVACSDDDDGEIIQPGQYKYEVNYTLPYGIPSSFEGVYGSVRYTAKVNIDKLFKDNNDMAQEFKVETPFDEPESTITNTNQFFNQMQPPIRVDNSVDYCCCGCRPSSLQITTTTTSGRYETGQSIPLTVECHNSKNVHKFKLDITLCKITSYHSTLPVTEVKRQTEILSKLTLTNKDHFDTKTWAGNLKVPFIDIPNLHKCAIIDIKFVIQTSVSIDGALRNIELNEIMLHIEPGEPIINCEAHAKLAPLQDTMEEFDSLLFYENTESPPLGYSETIF